MDKWMREHFKTEDKRELYFAAKCLGKMRLMDTVEEVDGYYNEISSLIHCTRDKKIVLEFTSDVLQIMKVKFKKQHGVEYNNEHL